MIALLVSVLLVVLIWYIVRMLLGAHPAPVQCIVDLVAVVVILLLALRHFGLVFRRLPLTCNVLVRR